MVKKQTLAPFRSNTALVATVEPWTRSAIAACSMWALTIAFSAPISGLPGVLGTFATRSFPSSINTKSVKVPPTSTPTRILAFSYYPRVPLTASQGHWQRTAETVYRGAAQIPD